MVSNGPHAEVVAVSHRLCAKLPDAVSDDAATFTPLAAIAWEGIGLLELKPGDRVILQIDSLRNHFTTFWGCVLGGFTPVTVAVAASYAEKNGVPA